MLENLVYIGKILSLDPIPDADRIVSATVDCAKGGIWRGVIVKDTLKVNDKCIVYLPDCIVPETEELGFMKKSNFRVRMQRYRGAPSEVLIMPTNLNEEVGADLTHQTGAKRYFKPLSADLNGIALGGFPDFIPKTDEPNYQTCADLINQLVGKPYYVTEKADGSSTTAYKYRGHFGVCSRNLELAPDENNGYWKLAIKYNLKETLPEGYAIQWETCGPGINKNSHGFIELTALAFSAYNIPEHRYLNAVEYAYLLNSLNFPMCPVVGYGSSFSIVGLHTLGEGTYANGNQREGVVVRSTENLLKHSPISFKVINLNYET